MVIGTHSVACLFIATVSVLQSRYIMAQLFVLAFYICLICVFSQFIEPAEDRNNLEKLTLAVLSHLPTAILYVHDLTGECGTSPSDQVSNDMM